MKLDISKQPMITELSTQPAAGWQVCKPGSSDLRLVLMAAGDQ